MEGQQTTTMAMRPVTSLSGNAYSVGAIELVIVSNRVDPNQSAPARDV